jgi:hypothetical protein
MSAIITAQCDLPVAELGPIVELLDQAAGSSLDSPARRLADALNEAYEEAVLSPGVGVSVRLVLT